MPNITISVSEETKKLMKAHPEVRWSNAIRAIIERKLEDFKESERLARKGGLTEKDIEPVIKKVEKDIAKRAERLLNEGNS